MPLFDIIFCQKNRLLLNIRRRQYDRYCEQIKVMGVRTDTNGFIINRMPDNLLYNTMEKFGYQKHEILVDRVVDARDEQQDAKEQFKTTLERFNEVVNFDGGELEEKHEILNAEFNLCEARAKKVNDRIAAVEDVGEALFKEWETELAQYSNAKLRRSSQQKMVQTLREYDQLIRSMHRAEDRIDPVLSAFRDQVLFLKHNLNASAIASLKNELEVVEVDVESLIREMEAAIAEADGFIKTIAKAR